MKAILAMDLETVDYNGKQIPVLMTFFNGVNPDKSMAFQINERAYTNPSLLENYVSGMWDEFLEYIHTTCKDKKTFFFSIILVALTVTSYLNS